MKTLIYQLRMSRATRIRQRAVRAYRRSLCERGSMERMFSAMTDRLYAKAMKVEIRAKNARLP